MGIETEQMVVIVILLVVISGWFILGSEPFNYVLTPLEIIEDTIQRANKAKPDQESLVVSGKINGDKTKIKLIFNKKMPYPKLLEIQDKKIVDDKLYSITFNSNKNLQQLKTEIKQVLNKEVFKDSFKVETVKITPDNSLF